MEESQKEVVEQPINTSNGESTKPTSKSYSEIVKGNRSGESGMALGYIPQGDAVEISEEE